MKYQDTKLFFTLLHTSEMFQEKAIMLFQRAVELETLPEIDFDYLLYVLKMEQNLYTAVDQIADKKIQDLTQ